MSSIQTQLNRFISQPLRVAVKPESDSSPEADQRTFFGRLITIDNEANLILTDTSEVRSRQGVRTHQRYVGMVVVKGDDIESVGLCC